MNSVARRSLGLFGATAVLGGLTAGFAFAAPQDFLPATGGIAIKYVNFETSSLEPGGITNGIFDITSIQDAGQTTTYWTDLTQPGAQGNLTGRFDNLTQLGPLVPGGGGFDFQLTGGTLTIYNVPSGSFNPSSPPTTDAQICGGPCPTPWLVAQFASGIDPTNSNVTVAGNQSANTFPFTAHSAGYLNVIGGIMASRLDTNSFTTVFGPRDLFLEADFCTRGSGVGCTFGPGNTWPIKSNDPVVGQLGQVPEPTSLLLVGSGLAAWGVWRLRRKVTEQ